jgi:uncharacterized protein
MIVVIDTNILLQLFGKHSPYQKLKVALTTGRIGWAISTPILLEYEEVILRLSNPQRWFEILRFIELLDALHGNIHRTTSTYRFQTITGDPDDDAFADCAIAANATFVLTEDRHFKSLRSAGYKPQPMTASEFVELYL